MFKSPSKESNRVDFVSNYSKELVKKGKRIKKVFNNSLMAVHLRFYAILLILTNFNFTRN